MHLIRFIRGVLRVEAWGLVCVCRGGLCVSTEAVFALRICPMGVFAVGFPCHSDHRCSESVPGTAGSSKNS